ncbi:hypothetical protein D3C72_2024620 [compost metagenome]
MAQSPWAMDTPRCRVVVSALSNGRPANSNAANANCSTQAARPWRNAACNTLNPQAMKKLFTSHVERSTKLTGNRRLAQKNAATAISRPAMLAMFSTCTRRSSNGITPLLACFN